MELKLILALLAAHFFGDFVFQSRWTAEHKSDTEFMPAVQALSKHLTGLLFALYASLFVIGFSPSVNGNQFHSACIAYVGFHIMQDHFLWRIYKMISKSERYWKRYSFWTVVGFDQLLHLGLLFVIFNQVS